MKHIEFLKKMSKSLDPTAGVIYINYESVWQIQMFDIIIEEF
jgi:hypothetical protein